MKVGIFGHYGNANLGDEAITRAAIESIGRQLPDAEIACFSINPADSAARYGVQAWPIRNLDRELQAHPLEGEPALEIVEPPRVSAQRHDTALAGGMLGRIKRWPPLNRSYHLARRALSSLVSMPAELAFLWRSFKVIRQFDLLMVTGSNQFLDNFGGVWGFPYTVLKWVILARLAGCKAALVSLGAGPLEGFWSKRFCRVALALSQHASYRDAPSRQLIEGPSPPYKGHVFPDVASNIELPDAPAAPSGSGLLVGINPMPVFDARYWHDADTGKYLDYVGKLVALVTHVADAGHRPLLFSTQVQDNAVIADVVAALPELLRGSVLVRQPRRVADLLKLLQQLDIAIPTRFHGNVLALRCGTPAIGICYHRKIGDLLSDMGLGKFQVDIETFEVAQITALFDEMVSIRDEAVVKIRERSNSYVVDCERQYEMIAALVVPQSAKSR